MSRVLFFLALSLALPAGADEPKKLKPEEVELLLKAPGERVAPPRMNELDAGTPPVVRVPSTPPPKPSPPEPLRPPLEEAVLRVTLLEAPAPVGVLQWGVVVRIEAVEPSAAPFRVGSTFRFVVHSPTKLFGGPSTPSKEYRFRVGYWQQKKAIEIGSLELAD